MKRLLSIFLALSMLVISTMSAPVYAGSAPVSLIVGSAEGAPGDTVSVPFSIKATEAIKTAGISKIAVDANAIEIKGFKLDPDINTDLVDDSMTKYSYIKATKTHTVSVKLYEDATFEEAYLIGTIEFKILENAASGEYPITFSTTAKNAATNTVTSEAGGDCKIVVTGGSVVPPAPTMFTVTFKADGSEIDSKEVEENSTIGTLPTAPEKAGYDFVEWQDEAGDKVTENTEVVSDMIVVAVYKEKQSPIVPPSTPELPDVPAVLIVGEATGTPGDTVSIPFSLKTKEPIKTAGISKITFDSTVLEIKGFTLDSNIDTDLVDDSMTKYSYIKATKTHTVSVKLFEDYTFETEYLIGTINFKILDEVENGEYPITFSTTAKNAATQTIESAAGGACKVVVTGGAPSVPKYTVKFMNGADTLNTLTIKEGNTVGTLPTEPTKVGYTFKGWFDGDAEITEATVVSGDITAEARFDINKYNVTFKEEGKADIVTEVEYNANVTLPAEPEKEGYNFIGWFDGDKEITNATVVGTEDITATAKFEAKEYNVKFVSFGETVKETKIKYGQTIGELPTVEKEGHTLYGWFANNEEVTADTVVKGDMEITADWTTNKYIVKFMNGTEVVSEAKVEYGSKVTLPEAPEKVGSTFAGWFADGVEVTADTVVGAADITAEAKFDINKYNVIFNSYQKEEVVVVEHGAAIPEDKIPEAAAKPGYNFVKWVLVEENVEEADWKEFDFATEITAAIDLFAIYEEIKIDIEVVDANGKAVDTVTVPYGTAIADIAKAIDDAITVNVVEDSEVKEADVKFDALDIKERVATVTIAYGDYSKEINVAYETKDAYIAVENADMLLLYPDYDGKSDDELAKFIYENAGIVVFDEYGIATTQDYTVTFAKDAKDETLATATVTAKYNDKDLEAKEIKVTLQPLGSSSSASGTVVRPSTGVVTGGGSANKPSTDDPATDDPSTDDPATDEPATDDPATDDPATDDPATDDPATDAPATDAPAADVPFTDVKADDWALDAIKDLHSRGIISGDESKALRPDSGITREEVSKIVLNVKGIEVDADATIDATDAHNVSEWAKGFVATAIKEGLLKGYEDGTVQSGKVVTRAELAAILVRAIGATAEFTASSFTDVGDAWYAAEVECAKNLGIVTGYEDGSFQGDKPVTRREAFAMAQRVIKLIEALENN